MATLHDRWRMNEQEVAAEVMDGEAILINLSTGVYYSLDGVGGFLWDLIAGGQSLSEMVDEVVRRYEVASDRAQADIEALAAELLAERLIVQLAPTEAGQRPPREVPAAPVGRAPYLSPKLEVYRDMEHLLALDPPMPGLKDLPWKDTSAPPPSYERTSGL